MKTKARLFRSTGIVSLGTLSSRLLGLAREILMAWTFGTSEVGSAFIVAFTIPNLFRRLFGEGALSAAFIPSYLRIQKEQGISAGWQLARNVSSLLVVVLGSISFIGMILCTFFLSLEELSPNIRDVLLSLRILLPYMIWICLAAITMGVLNAHRKYIVPAFAPCILNIVWIGVMWILSWNPLLPDEKKVEWICWSILLAGLLQFLVQIPSIKKLGYQKPEQVKAFGPEVKSVLRLMGPAALGAAIVQINVLSDRILAFWVADYGPLALSYSERLIYLPLGLFATALGTILLPEFSDIAQKEDRTELGRVLDQSLRGLMFVMIPASVGLAGLAAPIVQLVFERGQFNAQSTLYTSRALAFYAPGLVVFSASKIFIPLFYAHGDTRTPVKVGSATVLANLVINLLFIYVLPTGWKHAGLALGTVISSLLQVLILSRISQKRFAKLSWKPVLLSWGRQLLCCIPMMASAVGVLNLLEKFPIGVSTPAAIISAALVYGFSAVILRCPELKEFRHQ